jgi:hemerythrin-like domain-containing protein
MSTEPHTHTSSCWWDAHEAHWVCASGAGTPPRTAPAVRTPVDVRDMLVVHTALLREFRLAPAAVMRVEDGDVRRAAVVDRHLDFLCDLLHHHHEGEDALLWPLLRERTPDAAVRLVEAVESQHDAIDAALGAVSAARAAWVCAAGADDRRSLAGELDTLHVLLETHLRLEEREVLPLAAAVVTPAEWHAIGDAAAAAMSKPDLMLAFGMFAYEGDPEVLRSMLASAPAAPRMLVPRIGPRVYARRARRIHGTAHPDVRSQPDAARSRGAA